jgi:putative salt-induced outer membrane protein YdiY
MRTCHFRAIFLLAITFVCFFRVLTAQVPATQDLLRISLIDPGISYEKAASPKNTVSLHGVLRSRLSVGFSSSQGNTSDLYFDPSVALQFRHYYNLAKRQSQDRRISKNSGNYLVGLTEVLFSKETLKSYHLEKPGRRTLHGFSLGWGFQRNYKSHISLDIQLGVNFRYGRGTYYNHNTEISRTVSGRVSEMIQVRLGCWI